MVNFEGPENVRLPYLETFSKAAELSSFTGAAKALHLTQAAVSQRIHALEKTLQTSLFHRRGGRVLLTEAGMKHFVWAKGETVLQFHGTGPWSIQYLNAEDDPRNQKK